MIRAFFASFVALVLPIAAKPPTPDAIAKEILAPLLNPAKVATLKGDRPANARLYKVHGWLETARQRGGEISAVLDTAQTAAVYAGTPDDLLGDPQCQTARSPESPHWEYFKKEHPHSKGQQLAQAV